MEIDNGRIVRLRGDKNHPYTLGRCCPKGYAHVERMYAEDRLLFPQKKQPDGSFQCISWDDALDEIARQISNARKAHGTRSIAIYSGSGNDGMASRYAARFANVLGCRMVPGIAEICFEAAYEGARFNVGPFPPHELSDWLNSRCIVIWGTNKAESGIHSKRVIEDAIDNGAKLIVIDPRKIPHAKMADIHTTIRPGTDGALALGIANEIITRNLHDKEFIQQHVVGFNEFRGRVSDYDRRKVSRITWVPEHVITDIALLFATHGPALIATAPAGMNHYTNGTWAARAVHSLLAICGYLGKPGSGFQYLSSDHSPFNSAAITLHDKLDSDVKPIVPSATYLPDYILSTNESRVKVLAIQAASPVTQWPNTKKVLDALERIPFKVCIDLALTDTARLCDIVLPATFIFEHHNLVHSEIHRIVQYAPKMVEPRGEARSELYIWRDIAERLGLSEHFQITELDAIRLALQSHYCNGMTLEDLRKHPEGIRTSIPPIPFADGKYGTASGKVELYSEALEKLGEDPLPLHEEPLEGPMSTPERYEKYPLIMITGRLKHRLHSQYTGVTTGGSVKSYSHCTSCKKCISECPEEAITMVPPSAREIDFGVGGNQAHMRSELSDIVRKLAVEVSDRRIAIPEKVTSLLIPQWDTTKCIGCRECELDVCPFDVVNPTIRYITQNEAASNRARLRMHPVTAEKFSLVEGERVRVESVRGSVDPMILEFDPDLDPRIVWSADGWWQANGNINYLTDDKHTAYGSTPGFNSVLVRVTNSRF